MKPIAAVFDSKPFRDTGTQCKLTPPSQISLWASSDIDRHLRNKIITGVLKPMSQSHSDDLELRYETDDEEATDVENDEESDFTEPLSIIDPKATSFRHSTRSITVDMLDETMQDPLREIPG